MVPTAAAMEDKSNLALISRQWASRGFQGGGKHKALKDGHYLKINPSESPHSCFQFGRSFQEDLPMLVHSAHLSMQKASSILQTIAI